MPIASLRDLYVAELRNLHDAEKQILQELPVLADKASSADLKHAFRTHLDETHVHVERLELLLHQVDEEPAGHPCEAIRGLIEEAHRRSAEAKQGDVLDAALIGAAQCIEHYEIAAYGCARTYAETLGDYEAAHVLQQTLDEEGEADHRLTRLAERGINERASGEAPQETARHQSRLRYMPSSDVPEFRYSGYRVVNRQGLSAEAWAKADDDLGTLDGFIVESPSGRPIYFVVDSGGWFVGRRYVIPIGQLEADQAARVLWTDLDRETISRYPAFNPAAFLAMNDEEAIRYEHKLLNILVPGRTRARRRPRYEDLPQYRPPTWLMTGVWMTEASGFAAVPPRAQSDLRPPAGAAPPASEAPAPVRETSPENELMMARGESEERAAEADRQAREGADVQPRSTEEPKTTVPRIERYRER